MCFLFGHRPFVFDVTSTISKRWAHARNGGVLRCHIDGILFDRSVHGAGGFVHRNLC